MFKQILVPLDGSELAERALPVAERLAGATGATIHLVRVVPLPTASTTAGLYVPEALYNYDDLLAADTRAATEYLDGVRERVGASAAGVRATHVTGDIAGALLDYERDAGIDLVVMCSHGRGGLARFALGSIAARLLHHGAVPVLLVRAFGAPVDLAHTVVPLDGSELAEEALPIVAGLAPAVVRELTLLRVIHAAGEGPEAERYLDEVARRLQRQGALRGGEAGCRGEVAQGDPAGAILDRAGADKLVVMATHGRSGLTRWGLGSVADRVARGGAAAVLAVRAGTTHETSR